jgi:hypothetical protein
MVPRYGWQAISLISMFYAYILQSISQPEQLYRGHTTGRN